MHSRNKRFTLVFNGEIYNFLELRNDLRKLQHQFVGDSDTEVILAAFEEWGVKGATKLFNGMFAFAVWDHTERRLHLGRDRVGEKPLYYGWAGGVFLFGSELKALRAYSGFEASLDDGALDLYFFHGYVPAPYSIYSGVLKLLPGSILTIEPTDIGANNSPTYYWSPYDCAESGLRHPLTTSPEALVEEFDSLLRSSVELRMISDVPIGAFLSGGIDSSLVVSIMQSLRDGPVSTFSIGFDDERFNEADFAKPVAQHLGTDHTELYLSPTDAMSVIPSLPTLFDEPFADSSQIPTFLVSKLARTDVTVSLSGDGGDELFGGYSAYFSNARSWGRYASVPGTLRRLIARAIQGVPPDSWDNLFTAIDGFLPSQFDRKQIGSRLHRLARVLQQRTNQDAYQVLVSKWDEPNDILSKTSRSPTTFRGLSHTPVFPDFIDMMMFLDLVLYLPDDILTKVDRASMGVSLETRCPLLDHRIVEFAWRLPRHVKIRENQGKWLLRQLLQRYVPSELTERPKKGFAVPIGEWLRGPLRPWVQDLLGTSRLREEGVLNPDLIDKRWHAHLSEKEDWTEQLWTILMFQSWQESNAGVPALRT